MVKETQNIKILDQSAPSISDGGKKEVFYKGLKIPITKSGKPNMCFKICKETFKTEDDINKFMI
jgi:hypothetical protein